MVEAKASIIELASVNREMISPVRRVAKKDMGSSKYGEYRIKSHQCLISGEAHDLLEDIGDNQTN